MRSRRRRSSYEGAGTIAGRGESEGTGIGCLASHGSCAPRGGRAVRHVLLYHPIITAHSACRTVSMTEISCSISHAAQDSAVSTIHWTPTKISPHSIQPSFIIPPSKPYAPVFSPRALRNIHQNIQSIIPTIPSNPVPHMRIPKQIRDLRPLAAHPLSPMRSTSGLSKRAVLRKLASLQKTVFAFTIVTKPITSWPPNNMPKLIHTIVHLTFKTTPSHGLCPGASRR
jgi:hypothetical protein